MFWFWHIFFLSENYLFIIIRILNRFLIIKYIVFYRRLLFLLDFWSFNFLIIFFFIYLNYFRFFFNFIDHWSFLNRECRFLLDNLLLNIGYFGIRVIFLHYRLFIKNRIIYYIFYILIFTNLRLWIAWFIIWWPIIY